MTSEVRSRAGDGIRTHGPVLGKSLNQGRAVKTGEQSPADRDLPPVSIDSFGVAPQFGFDCIPQYLISYRAIILRNEAFTSLYIAHAMKIHCVRRLLKLSLNRPLCSPRLCGEGIKSDGQITTSGHAILKEGQPCQSPPLLRRPASYQSSDALILENPRLFQTKVLTNGKNRDINSKRLRKRLPS
jgi:hypothetical protein